MSTVVNGKTMICPQCGSNDVVNNGSIHTGENKFLCNECGHQFVASNSKGILVNNKDDKDNSFYYNDSFRDSFGSFCDD